MRVAIAGAGAVGRSIARELIGNGHEVLLIDKDPASIKPDRVPDAEWLLADSCELSSLEEARMEDCDVVIAATGDDKANLVTSLLAKTEFGVPRTVGRVNHPNNEWLFTEAWGVDVNVSTPRIMSALVEEAVTVGDLVRLFTFRKGNANLVEMTLPTDSPYVGKPSGLVPFPENCSLVTILRDGQVYTPEPDQPIEAGDELLFVVPAEIEEELEKMLAPSEHGEQQARELTVSGDSVRALQVRLWLAGLDRDAVAAQHPHHRREGGDLERPAHRQLRHAQCRDRGVGRPPAVLAGQVDRSLHDHPSQARQRQQPGQPAAQADDVPVGVPRGRVARDAADDEPDDGPADRDREDHQRRVAEVVEQPRKEVGQRLLPRVARHHAQRATRTARRCRCRTAR